TGVTGRRKEQDSQAVPVFRHRNPGHHWSGNVTRQTNQLPEAAQGRPAPALREHERSPGAHMRPMNVNACAASRAGPALFHSVFLVIALMLIAARALAGSLTLAWDPVSSPALAGYMLYYGPAAGNYTSKIDVGNTTMRTVANLTDGATYHFAVTAYDSSRVESGFSN